MEDPKIADRRYNIVITALIFALIVMIVVLVHYKLTRTNASGTIPAEKQSSKTKLAPVKQNVKKNTTAQGKIKTRKEITPVKTTTPPAQSTGRTRVQYDDTPLGTLSNPTILIEKSKLRLTVFDRNGKIVKRYRAAVGGTSGDKLREGDLRTPEGKFYVCVKNPKSKHVLALGLSYPNISDAERGYRSGLINKSQYDQIVYAIRKGRRPPWNTPLGGEIMIHGHRKGGRDTEGCIALEDNDIRELYPQIPLGTRVIIKP